MKRRVVKESCVNFRVFDRLKISTGADRLSASLAGLYLMEETTFGIKTLFLDER